tara:strand:- start:488 stop:643 length:156 start_codon:yes stop_codon:yes gene_type:complete
MQKRVLYESMFIYKWFFGHSITPGVSENKNDYIHLQVYRQAIAFIKKEKNV